MKLVSHGKPVDNTAPKQTKSPSKFSSSKHYAKHLPKQQPTHFLGLHAIAYIASLISPSVVKLHIPRGCYGDRTTESHGTGFLIDNMGTILTCCDVVINPYRPNQSYRDEVVVITKDGKKLMGEVEFYRKELDISIVKVKSDKKLTLPHLKLETSSNLFVGQWVMCVGSHGGHNNSLTKGIISHLYRTSSDLGIKGEHNVYIQVDCLLSEDSFGSPLSDLNDKVIGVVVKMERRADGIGFALQLTQSVILSKDITFSVKKVTFPSGIIVVII